MSYKSAEKIFYEKHYGNSDWIFSKSIDKQNLKKNFFNFGKRYHLIDQIIDRVMIKSNLLEIGCSSGDTLRYIAEVYKFQESIGIDIAYKEKVKIEGQDNVFLMPANCNEDLPFLNGSMDLIVAMMVIEHLFDPFHSFLEIKRLLSEGGVAVINLPLVTGIKNRLRLLFGKLPITSVEFSRWFDDKEWDGNHLHYFSVKSIEILCNQVGLEIIKISSVGRFTAFKNLYPQLLASELTFAVKHSL